MQRSLLLGALLLASSLSAQTPLALQAREALGLDRAQVVGVDVYGTPGQEVLVAVDFGAPLVLRLTTHSVLADGFQLLEDDGTGPKPVEVGAIRTYRGTALGFPQSYVAASLLPDGLHARIVLSADEELWVEPLQGRVPGATARDHVAYRTADVTPTGHSCGTDLLANARPVQTAGARQPGTGNAAFAVAELGCDADFEYFLDYGSSGAVMNRINSVVNTMNAQYERDVGITHEITTILVRTSSSQPYTSTDASTLLNQFRSEWTNNQGGVQRDVAQLFTGKSINGGTIGIAWLGVICNSSYGYGMVESDFNNNFSSATDLSAHELGHNWDADHCSCTSFTMNPFITSSNVFSPQFTIGEIEAHRDSRTCLGSTGGGNPTEISVSSITVGQQGIGRGRKVGTATVTINDDLGNPVSGVTVSGTFTGEVTGSDSATTNGSGVATLSSTTSAKGKVNFTFCVDNVTGGSLPYNASANTETCDSK